MHSRTKRFSVPLALLFLLLLPSLLWGAPGGRVTKVSGKAFFRTAKSAPYARLATGREVATGNWVKTGRNGWIEITLADGSTFTIANDSELELTSLDIGPKKREGIFSLGQGKLRASVTRLAGRQAAYTIRSRTVVAGVKGTEFLMLSAGPANVLFGTEGTVAVRGDGTEGRALTADTMTQNTRGFTPTAPIKIEPGTPLDQARRDLNAVTGAVPPADWLVADNLTNIIARWDINYGHYLADAGKYDDALHIFQIALDLSNLPAIRSDAHLERGGVYAHFLADPEAALSEYLLVLGEYPGSPQAETALFGAGQALYDLGFHAEAAARFRQYLKEYPNGEHRSSAETLLHLLEKP